MNTALHVMSEVAAVLIDPKAEQPPGTDNIWLIAGWGKFGGFFVAALALIGAIVVMVLNNRRGEAMQHTGTILGVLFGVVGISAAFSIINVLAG